MRKYRSHSRSSTSSNQSSDTCPLHLGRLQDAYTLPCGHVACQECLHAIATASRKYRRQDIRCPVCQQESPFEPEKREQEEAQSRATSSACGELSRSNSVTTSSVAGSTSPVLRRFAIALNEGVDSAASKVCISSNPMVNKRVTITLQLWDTNGRMVEPQKNTYVRGTIRLPNQERREIDLLPARQAASVEQGGPTHSFEKVIVPDLVGQYEVEVNISGNVKSRILAHILVKPSGGKVFDLRGSSKFKNPHDVLVIGGQYVITDKGNHRIIVTDADGVVQMEFGSHPPKGLKKIGPFGVAGDPEAFYVTDDANKCVLQFLRQNAKLRVWAKVGPSPTGICLDTEHVYVADAMESNIRVFNRHARQLFTIAYRGNLEGSINFPWFIKINSMGQLVVADRNNCRIQVFDPVSKKSIASIPLVLGGKQWHCRGLAVDRCNNIFVTARRTDSWRGCSRETVMVFSPTSEYIGNFGELREFDYLRGIAIDSERSAAVVVDGANHRIKGYRL